MMVNLYASMHQHFECKEALDAGNEPPGAREHHQAPGGHTLSERPDCQVNHDSQVFAVGLMANGRGDSMPERENSMK